MSPELERLIRLQEVETRALDAQQRIASAPGRIAELDAKLTASKDAVAASTQALADNQSARRTLEKDQLAVQQRLGKYKEQLMEVKTNHEYHAMQQQIAATTAELGRVEEQILVNMMAADEVSATLKGAQAQLKTDETSIRDERQAIEADAKAAERTIAESTAERAALVASMDPNNVAIFEWVLKARQGLAVAEFAGGICTACRMRLRPMVYDQVRRNEDIVQCDYCQRILYYVPPKVEPASGAEPSPPASPAQPQ
jgi:predicted  nucleic acid-binding Zn-ribbon protein